jgi:GNAT superfamily N-acetyltransferase|tara:strand:- start:241 stop:693 length:453 start_codon:yes stop_codon:yes gene_type:complete
VISIRPAVAADCQSLTELALAAKAFWGYSDQQMLQFTPALTVTDQMVARWRSGVLQETQGATGFYLLDDDGAEAELMLLYVSPLHMGKGYGRKLFTAAATTARKRGHLHIRIAADPHAGGFYKRMGARQSGWCRSHWNSAEELPLYRLKL